MKTITPTNEEFEFFRFSEELAAFRAKEAARAKAEKERKEAAFASLRQKRNAMIAKATKGSYPDDVPRYTRARIG